MSNSNSGKFRSGGSGSKSKKIRTIKTTTPAAAEVEMMEFRPFKNRFANFVRARVEEELVKKGFDRQAARAMAETVDDDEIDQKREQKLIGKLGDGSFLQWLIDHKEQILELIMAIVSILAMF